MERRFVLDANVKELHPKHMKTQMEEIMFDVSDYTFDIPDIVKHMHVNKKRAETIKAQQRLLKKWLCSRERMHAFTRLSSDEISARQLEKVSFLIDYAFSTHPFYHKLYKTAGYQKGDIVTWDDYNQLPTISKEDVIQNYDLFASNLDQKDPKILTAMTSGSSGRVITAHFDQAMIDTDVMQCFRFEEQMLGRPRDPSEWLYQVYVNAPPFSSLGGSYPIFTVANACPPKAVLEHLHKIKPVILSGIPSHLLQLASLVDDPEKLGIKAVCTNSEPSTPEERKRIGERLNAQVFDEYSSVELCLIATQCKEGHYHIVEDNVRVDVLNPDETGAGDIVATNLNNIFMPLIRYRQGDTIRIVKDFRECACGSTFRQLETFMGRNDQTLESRKVGKVRSDLIMAAYDNSLLVPEANVDQFQIVQEKMDELIVNIVPKKEGRPANPESVQALVTALKSAFEDPDLSVRVQEMRELPPNKSYKRKLIENRLQHNTP